MDETVLMVATCHTPGCPVEGRPFTAPFYPNPDPPTFRGQCGQCGQPVTDIVPVPVPA